MIITMIKVILTSQINHIQGYVQGQDFILGHWGCSHGLGPSHGHCSSHGHGFSHGTSMGKVEVVVMVKLMAMVMEKNLFIAMLIF